ncbi:beta-carotene hydroxylase CrtZ [Psychroflexus torquis ATCC 700755]|uniref:Beta-carotene hydroxylase CrtZ n=1 Tax=Psychroflexus torquis (strain ATCC 700755 / CIP 106069 / ACAM 623) TaxID=313595 RepID=K4IB32_PSYTT|nr:beta-carotene hydroxylase [Psychroflexus torquis]AFU67634.1 beta-carotene hydroxylase CrtZ [Psychroflexus torquis ATCC 700755]
MEILIWIVVFLATFLLMEFMAWFSHKYIMHGFLWILHKDHHHKDHKSWWERNDLFFVFYAVISMYFFMVAQFQFAIAIGAGIAGYGLAYFVVHDIFIHQRFKLFRKANHWYAKGIRRAHKIHHKHLGKGESECFGMLIPPLRFLKNKK